MTLRRLGLAVPLAILVALLVHLATFGLQHAPGAEHSTNLIDSVAAALALAALCTILLVALRRRREGRRARSRYVFPADLTFGGAVAYAAIERSEGHAAFGYGWSSFTLFAVAALVYGAALFCERMLRYCGEALAALADRIAPSYRTRVVFTTYADRFVVALTRCSRASRGRAPPLLSWPIRRFAAVRTTRRGDSCAPFKRHSLPYRF